MSRVPILSAPRAEQLLRSFIALLTSFSVTFSMQFFGFSAINLQCLYESFLLFYQSEFLKDAWYFYVIKGVTVILFYKEFHNVNDFSCNFVKHVLELPAVSSGV